MRQLSVRIGKDSELERRGGVRGVLTAALYRRTSSNDPQLHLVAERFLWALLRDNATADEEDRTHGNEEDEEGDWCC